MASSIIFSEAQFEQDAAIWQSLKEAIALSSGFQEWVSQKTLSNKLPQENLDYQVRRYLRETLETLAY